MRKVQVLLSFSSRWQDFFFYVCFVAVVVFSGQSTAFSRKFSLTVSLFRIFSALGRLQDYVKGESMITLDIESRVGTI